MTPIDKLIRVYGDVEGLRNHIDGVIELLNTAEESGSITSEEYIVRTGMLKRFMIDLLKYK